MPIKFRCPNCSQFLGISRASAGAIVDCPSCGRTIRVPQTDGRVEPLPPPRLDLQDQALQQALDQLANLDSSEDSDSPFVMAPTTATVEPTQAPAPIPVRIETPVPPQLTPQPGVDVPASPEEVLSELTAKQPVPSAAASTRLTPFTRRDVLVAASTTAVIWPLAWLLGRSNTQVGPIPAAQNTEPSPAPPPAQAVAENGENAAAPVGLGTAIRGRITYIAPDGESRADAGARILVLPEKRLGTARLSVAGFRSGASETDAQLARESLRLLGGAFTLADSLGNYAASLTSSGPYHLLLISRYQAGDSRPVGFDELDRVLGEYFDKPAQLIGQMRYDFSRFRYQGQEPAIRDHVFQRI